MKVIVQEMVDRNDPSQTVLPISRIKTIMKSSPDVSAVGNESLFLIAKATEIFVRDLALNCSKNCQAKENVQYNDLANIIHEDDTLMFLQDIIPKKILAREYIETLQHVKEADSS